MFLNLNEFNFKSQVTQPKTEEPAKTDEVAAAAAAAVAAAVSAEKGEGDAAEQEASVNATVEETVETLAVENTNASDAMAVAAAD